MANPSRRQEAVRSRPAADPLLDEVLVGLRAPSRSLPSRFFYDARGSQLFQWICALPDYYLTRIERQILRRHAAGIAAPFAGLPCAVVDLGAGDGHKSRLLLEQLRRVAADVTYAPVDLSASSVREAADRVGEQLDGVGLLPVEDEYRPGLRRVSRHLPRAAKLVLFLGSSIGNLESAEAGRFLGEIRRSLRAGDRLLVGFDMVKPLGTIRRAYDDPQGVTRAFNLNLLLRINRELGADFDPSAFRHRATWDPGRPAMESWLESVRRQTVHVGGESFSFARGERIHTEISCKYRPEQIGAFARAAGFEEEARFQDERGWFADALWRAGREGRWR